jgi:hypothetical protein
MVIGCAARKVCNGRRRRMDGIDGNMYKYRLACRESAIAGNKNQMFRFAVNICRFVC